MAVARFLLFFAPVSRGFLLLTGAYPIDSMRVLW